MIALTFPLIASLLNRWRGGSWPFLPKEIHGGPNDKKRTQVRRIAFGLGVSLMAWNPWIGVLAYLSCLLGWGFPVSAAIGYKTGSVFEPEIAPLDWLAKKITSLIYGSYEASRYGVVWLTLRGAFFGALICYASGSFAFLGLALMGLAYKVSKDIEVGEYVYGAIWGLCLMFYVLVL